MSSIYNNVGQEPFLTPKTWCLHLRTTLHLTNMETSKMPVICSGIILKTTNNHFWCPKKESQQLLDYRAKVGLQFCQIHLLITPYNYTVKANLQKAHAVPVEMIMGHHKIQPSARAKRAAGLSSNAELCTKSDSDMERATTGTKRKNNKSSSNPRKKSRTSQPPPKKAAHNSSFTPATDQPIDRKSVV